MQKTTNIIIVILISFYASVVFGADPLLFFSDLREGPKIGWEGSNTRGAAVTIWGKNFGSSRGHSYVTVNGAKLDKNSDYAEWGTVAKARELQRITFWLNNNCTDGAGEITVTVNGITSNTLPFTIKDAEIYFISVNEGSNSYNGKYASYQGDDNGPWRDIKMFDPANNPSSENKSYIVYVREGVYTAQDQHSCFCYLYGPSGTANTTKAIIAYPQETPTLNLADASRGGFRNAKGSEGGPTNYYTISKLKFINGTSAIDLWGEYNKFIGNHFANNNLKIWSGLIMLNNAQHTYIYGNYFYHDGYDSYKHVIYVKTHRNPSSLGNGQSEYNYIGWNEFDSWTAALNPNDQPSRGGAIFVSTESYANKDGKQTNHIFIFNNFFHGGDSEAIFTGDGCGNEIYIYNNIFANINSGSESGITLGGAVHSTVYLYNNIFYKIGKASKALVYIRGTDTETYFKNNIFYTLEGQDFIKLETYNGATYNSENDCYYSPDGTASIPSGRGITISKPINEKPLFVDLSKLNFYPKENSPVNDKGTQAVKDIVTYDYNGYKRPLATNFDIGVYEYCDEQTNTGIKIQKNRAQTPDFILLPSYPNPFNSSTIINYELKVATNVTLAIYDTLGRRIVTLVKGRQLPGRKKIKWNGRDRHGSPVASGAYFVTLSEGTYAVTQKILLLR